MAVTTYLCESYDATGKADHTPYDANGAQTAVETDTDLWVGQNTGFSLRQAFLGWDLTSPYSGSAIAAGASISAATFSVWANDVNTTDSFYIEACRYAWGSSPIDGSDQRSTTQMTSLFGTGSNGNGSGCFAYVQATSSWPSWMTAEANVDFTSGQAMLTDIAACIGGSLQLVLFSAQHMAGTQPSTNTSVSFAGHSNATQAHRPKLVVTWTAAAGFTGLTVYKTLSG